MLSTISNNPCFLAIPASAPISVTFIIGFVGVSMYIAFVLSLTWDSTSSLEQATLENSIPFFSETLLNNLILPPYRSDSTIRWSPGLKSSIIRVIAAIPVESASASIPPSRLATTFSRCSLVGF